MHVELKGQQTVCSRLQVARPSRGQTVANSGQWLMADTKWQSGKVATGRQAGRQAD